MKNSYIISQELSKLLLEELSKYDMLKYFCTTWKNIQHSKLDPFHKSA